MWLVEPYKPLSQELEDGNGVGYLKRRHGKGKLVDKLWLPILTLRWLQARGRPGIICFFIDIVTCNHYATVEQLRLLPCCRFFTVVEASSHAV